VNESSRSEPGSVTKNVQSEASNDSIADLTPEKHTAHEKTEWPHRVVNNLPDANDEVEPDATSLSFDGLLELYSTSRQRNKLYREKCTQVSTSAF
jgi:hypothetical protein